MANTLPKRLVPESGAPRIRVLPEFIVNQISAGEVVERPASVVRELLDNSIDAGATDIAVTIEDGGRRLIRVTDNGRGMERDDALLAFENHATSKVSDLKDLAAIKTFGFRGEALASIAAVAKVQLRTRTATSEVGTKIIIEGGKLLKVEAVPCNVGTEITVSSLFFNTPARRKFLKKPETEEAKIKQWIIQSAAPHFAVRYRCQVDGRHILNFPAANRFIDRAASFVKGNCLPINKTKGDIAITGLIGHPGSASTSAASLVIVVNKRVVKDGVLVKAVRQGFASTLKSYESPVGVIAIDLPHSQVDVNVHPQKSEVRFLAPGDIFAVVRDAVLETVNQFSSPIVVREEKLKLATRSTNEDPFELKQSNRSEVSIHSQGVISYSSRIAPVAEISYRSISGESAELDGEQVSRAGANIESVPTGLTNKTVSPNPFRYSDLRYIGQIFECYLLCEKSDRFYVLDMHAAHERCNYNKIRSGFLNREIPQQMLLTPVVVRLSSEGFRNISDNLNSLKDWGFEIEQFGSDEVVVRSTPSFIPPSEISSLIQEISKEDMAEASGTLVSERIDHIAARIACHGSIRSGKVMNREEAYALFQQLDEAELAGACPHGRPIMVNFPLTDVEKWFGRDK